jgi:hypothetical protein
MGTSTCATAEPPQERAVTAEDQQHVCRCQLVEHPIAICRLRCLCVHAVRE